MSTAIDVAAPAADGAAMLHRRPVTEHLLESVADSLPRAIETFATSAQNEIMSINPEFKSGLSLLELCGISTPVEAAADVSTTLRDHVLARIPLLTKPQAAYMLRQLIISGPISPPSIQVFTDLVAKFDAKSDMDLWKLFADATSVKNVPPAAILALPPAARLAVWKAAYGRFSGDINYLLQELPQQRASQIVPWSLGTIDASLGIALRGGKLQKNLVMAIISGVGLDPGLYKQTCERIKALYYKTWDPKWAILRYNVHVVLTHMYRKDASVVAKFDPLDKLIIQSGQFVAGKTTPQELLLTIRKAIESAKPPSGFQGAGTSALQVTKMRPKVKEAIEETMAYASSRGPLSTPFTKSVKEFGYTKDFVASYLAKVKRPMDYGTMKKHCLHYKSWEEPLAEADLIVANSQIFNGEASPYTREAAVLRDFLKERISIARSELESASYSGTADAGKAGVDMSDILFVCNDPHLLRKAAQLVVLDALPASCASGSKLYERATADNSTSNHADAALCSLFLLILADISRTKLREQAAARPPPTTAQKFRGRKLQAVHRASTNSEGKPALTTEQVLQVLGPMAPGASMPVLQSSVPVHIELLCRLLQNIYLRMQLTSEDAAAEPDAGSVDILKSFDTLFTESDALCSADELWSTFKTLLQRGSHIFTVTLTYLLSVFLTSHAQEWDNASWELLLRSVSILCTKDGEFHPAYFYSVAHSFGKKAIAISVASKESARKVIKKWFLHIVCPLLEAGSESWESEAAVHEFAIHQLSDFYNRELVDADTVATVIRCGLSCFSDHEVDAATGVPVNLKDTLTVYDQTKFGVYLRTLITGRVVSAAGLRFTSPEFSELWKIYVNIMRKPAGPDAGPIAAMCGLADAGLSAAVLRRTDMYATMDTATGISASPLATPHTLLFSHGMSPLSPYYTNLRRESGVMGRLGSSWLVGTPNKGTPTPFAE